MNEFFGISMTAIMMVLLVLLGVAFGSIALVALRHRLLFRMGVRNIPRRRSQTVLIVIGLMLSTLIITSAFAMGDTFHFSVSKTAYDQLYSVDETVQAFTESEDPFVAGLSSIISPRPIPEDEARGLVEQIAALPGIDGAAPLIRGPLPATHRKAGLSEPYTILAGVDPAAMSGFPDITSLDGEPLRLSDLAEGEIYANESAADKLELAPGDTVTLLSAGQPYELRVRAIVKDRLLTGSADLIPEGFVMPLAAAQRVFGRAGQVDAIVVSNDGGVREGLRATSSVMPRLERLLEGTPWEASPTKQNQIDAAEFASSQFTFIFLLMGSFSIAAGMLLVFLVFVMLAAERKPEMGISRALGSKRNQLIEMFASEGMAYNVGAAFVGCALGVLVSIGMVRVMMLLLAQFDIAIAFNVTLRSLVVSYSLGVVLTFATVTFSAWRVSKLNIVSAIRDIPEPAARRSGSGIVWIALAVLGGPALVALGTASKAGASYSIGIMLSIVAVAAVARRVCAPRRAVFTVAAGVILVYWLASAGDNIPFEPELNGGWEMFLLSGLGMIGAATIVILYNLDVFLFLLALPGAVIGWLLPPIVTAVAYPTANRFRTGMTIATIAIVVFSLVVMSTIQSNFNHLFLNDYARGGYDIIVTENPGNPIDDLSRALEGAGHDTSVLAGIDGVASANRAVSQVREALPGVTDDDYQTYPVYGATSEFAANNDVKLQLRAAGYASDDEVWAAVAADPGLAVVDGNVLPTDFTGVGGSPLVFEGISSGDAGFEPIEIEVRNGATGTSRGVKVIGIMATAPSQVFMGVFVHPDVIDAVYGGPESTIRFVRVAPGVDDRQEAREIERALLAQGVQADSLRELIDTAQQVQEGFLWLIQGFMGLGLLVGIAAVGVIAFRAVVERRQQIGVMRAIGYTRAQVALSFVLESSLLALLGVSTGIALGLALSQRLLFGNAFDFGFTPTTFYVEWLQIGATAAFSIIAAVLMTLIPAARAASMPVAETMRYE
jgi:putative ABC transport system permease protein